MLDEKHDGENEKNSENLEKANKKRKFYFEKIEKYFINKKSIFNNYKHIPIEEILLNAPRYYSLIRVIEQVNSFLSKDCEWLKKFIMKNNINFDWDTYKRWKAGKHYKNQKYDDTKCPAKWVHLLQDSLIEILKALQLLFFVEFYISDNDFKKFLKQFPKIDLKRTKNYMKESSPSENIDKVLSVIDFLLKKNIETDFTTNLVISTTDCMKIYRKIDEYGILNLLKCKKFYIKYRMEYLIKMPEDERFVIPYEDDLIAVCEEFLNLYYDINLSYKECKAKLIEKYDKIRRNLR